MNPQIAQISVGNLRKSVKSADFCCPPGNTLVNLAQLVGLLLGGAHVHAIDHFVVVVPELKLLFATTLPRVTVCAGAGTISARTTR